jgi:hypothetical protein
MNCNFGQVDASLEPSIYGVAESIICVDIFIVGQKCAGGGVKVGAKFPFSLGVRYHKPDCNTGLQGFFSAGPPTLFITGEVDLPSRFEFSFQYQPQVLMLTCAVPGGCTGKLF